MTTDFPQFCFVKEAMRRSDIEVDWDDLYEQDRDWKAEQEEDRKLEAGENPEDWE